MFVTVEDDLGNAFEINVDKILYMHLEKKPPESLDSSIDEMILARNELEQKIISSGYDSFDRALNLARLNKLNSDLDELEKDCNNAVNLRIFFNENFSLTFKFNNKKNMDLAINKIKNS